MRIKRYLSTHRMLLSMILIFFILLIPSLSCSAQDENSRILNEIDADWSTNMILIYVETPNKFDRTYGTNITDKAVLDEISSIEEALDPQKDDYGDDDEISFILSISTLIKEINLSPKNIYDATIDELDIPPGPIGVEGEYVIPDNQDDIDRIVDQIPEETKKLLVIDTNNDEIWDSAVILIGVIEHNTNILKYINELIDPYFFDPDASRSDYNSRNSWWSRVESSDIHCAMTNIGYVDSSEIYRSSDMIDLWLPLIVIIILVVLLLLLVFSIKSKLAKADNEIKKKRKILTIVVVFLILIGICLPFFLIRTSTSESEKLSQYSDELRGGQVGLVLVRGNPAPAAKNEPTKGGGSMKDIEVLDNISLMEERLKIIEGINPPLSIVDIMKMIKISEGSVELMKNLTPVAEGNMINAMLNNSFWDAIHLTGQNESLTWYLVYGKSFQDTLINIFYNSITIEMRSTFVNIDFSKSLIYLQIPIMDEEETEKMLNSINKIIEDYPAGKSTANAALLESGKADFQNISRILKAMYLLFILLIGIIAFILFNLEIRREKNGGKKESQAYWPEGRYPPQR
ncbi:MAG: hypothetical protein JSV09_00135 [Thermoplasmata archaeon]|nr:MAG: hypothetical protein JSV09_00135 [Thermoplasmata archaeon]